MSIEPFIKCRNMDTSIKFYTEILDFKVIVCPDPDPQSFMSKYAQLKRENNLVHLSSHCGDGTFGSLIYIRVNNVEQLYNQFIANGLNTTNKIETGMVSIELITQSWGMKEFKILDPDGNAITFGQPFT